MKKLLTLALFCLFLLAACATPVEEETYKLYFPSASYVAGSALAEETFIPGTSSQPIEETLIAALLKGPKDTDLHLSPFPRGVTLRSWSVRDGLLSINLSEQYGGLSGMALTLADYSIALTMCQLPGVEGVSITVENDPMPFRYRQVLTPEDILLSDLAGPETVTE